MGLSSPPIVVLLIHMALPIVILLFGLIFLLLYAANMIVASMHQVARLNHTSVFTLSAIFMATATSLPELSVAINSGLSGNSALSLGNVLGANITNLTLISGAAAIIGGGVVVHGKLLRREIYLAGAAGVLPLLLIIDGTLSRIDGLILIVLWVVYVAHFFHIKFTDILADFREKGFWHRFLHRVEAEERQGGGKLLAGIVLLVISAHFIVKLSSSLSADAGISLFIVGALVLAVGTTLPELVFSFRSLKAGEPTMFLGNILGSIITNSTLVLGIAALISPIVVNFAVWGIGIMFILIYILFWYFVGEEKHIARREALILLTVYLLFVFLVGRQ